MKPVKVSTSKRIAKTHDAVGCVVFCFGPQGEMSYASYGSNKHNCDEMYQFAQKVWNRYYDGQLHEVKFKEGPRSPFPRETQVVENEKLND